MNSGHTFSNNQFIYGPKMSLVKLGRVGPRRAINLFIAHFDLSHRQPGKRLSLPLGRREVARAPRAL